MDLVVRTPHGDADLSVVSSPDTATLADLVEVATGQVAPPLVRIDDRPIDAATRLRDAPLLIGSVVSSHPAGEEPSTRTAVQLLQLAGSGAGTVRTLEPGRYRVGPGRRLSAVELADAPVEHPVFEMVIERAAVTVVPVSGDDAGMALELDGRPVSGPTPWAGEHLVAGTRVFTVEPSAPGANRRRSLDADQDGSVQFSRSPQLTVDDSTPLVVEAVRRAERSDPMLWQRRVGGGGGGGSGVVLPFGLVDEHVVGQRLRQVSITLEYDRPAAVVGTETFREALARTLLIEATTRYGPAELAIVLATRADRLTRWDWVKWLPHLQTPGDIAVLSSDDELSAWAQSVSGSLSVPGAEPDDQSVDRPSRATLVVVDDADLWSRSDSPWRQLITSPVPNIVMLALADRIDVAPPTTRTVIAQDRDHQRCRLTVAGRSQPLVDVLPALVEPELATRVARALAPLRDSELAPAARVRAPDAPALTLTDALRTLPATGHPVDGGAVTIDPTDALTVVLGTDPTGAPVHACWRAGGRWSVEGPDVADVATTALTAVLSTATNRAPDQVRFVLIAPATASVLFSVMARLPHFAGRCDADDPAEVGRLLARLEQHLDDGGSALVVVEPSEAHVRHVAALCSLAARRPGLRVLDMTILRGGRPSLRPPHDDVDAPAMSITIDRRARQLRGVATTTDREGAAVEFAFDPFALRSTSADEALVVRPFVYGRALTPLERQLERAAVHVTTSPFGAEVDAVTAEIVLVDRELGGMTASLLVPPPLPSSLAFDQLLADHEADAVPIGLADDPVHGRHDIVWWQPGSAGSMLFIGSPRSGMDVVIETLPVGIAERYAEADIHLHAIDSSNRRLGALQRVPHVRAAVSPDRLDQAAAIIDLIALEAADRRVAGSTDRPALVLLIGDLTQLGRRLRDSSYAATLDSLHIVATSGDVGVNVIGTASRASDSCGLVDVVESVFVGAVSRSADAGDVDIDGPGPSGTGPGRCRWSVTDQIVQLAAPAPTLPPPVSGPAR